MDILHQLGRLSRGARALLGEAAHFFRYDREPSAMLARPRRFDRRVEGQQVREVREVADRCDEAGDPPRDLTQLLHLGRALAHEQLQCDQALDGFTNLLAVAARHVARRARGLRRLGTVHGDAPRDLRQALGGCEAARDFALLGHHALADHVRGPRDCARRVWERMG